VHNPPGGCGQEGEGADPEPPRLALPRIVAAGNDAGEGAKIAALSLRERAEAQSILREVEYVELSGRADFNDLFIDQLALPE